MLFSNNSLSFDIVSKLNFIDNQYNLISNGLVVIDLINISSVSTITNTNCGPILQDFGHGEFQLAFFNWYFNAAKNSLLCLSLFLMVIK